jgi:hypothetical protein
MRINVQPKYLEHGYLSSLLYTLYNKGKITKLENNTLTHIATILARLARDYDLYQLLFEDEDQVLEVEKRHIHSKDLAAFVLMDHTFTRGYFAKTAGRSAMSDTTNSSGIPLLFEGSKRLFNTSYMSWLNKMSYKQLDMFLPAQLNSYELNQDGEIVRAEKYGLLVYHNNNIEFDAEVIATLRSRVNKWDSNPTPAQIKVGKEDEDEELLRVIEIYNKSSYRMRNMVLQGWCWNKVCRSSYMITNWNDWDAEPIRIDELAGLQPKAAGRQVGIEKFLGIKL